MVEKKHTTIFEAAAKKLALKKGNIVSTSPTDTKKEATPPTPAVPAVRRDPEVREMMKKIEDMKQDLSNKMENIHRKSGLTYDQIRVYMENPKNFSKTEWEKIQKTKDELGEKVWNALGQELKPKTTHERENIAGERKAKTLGARKRWIPMK
jgi:hypothetical protein